MSNNNNNDDEEEFRDRVEMLMAELDILHGRETASISDGNDRETIRTVNDSDANRRRSIIDRLLEYSLVVLLTHNRQHPDRPPGSGLPAPVARAVVERMVKVSFEEESGETGTCPICLLEFELGLEIVLTACSHLFHADCLLSWIEKSNTCPMCRANFALV